MINIEIKKNCFLYHSEIVELINLVVSLFSEKGRNKNYKAYYKDDFIENIKKKYRFLSIVFGELKNNGMEMHELYFYPEYFKNNFSELDIFEKFLLSLGLEDFFYVFFDKSFDKKSISMAVDNTNILLDYYEKNDYICNSFAGLKMLFDNREKFIIEFCSCAREMNNQNFKDAMNSIEQIIVDQRLELLNMLSDKEPLEVSQQIMGKTFYNRGPYKEFLFMPSIFLPYRAMRFFYDYQILMYVALNGDMTRTDAVNALKALSDDSRFKILEILKNSGPMIGKDLADKLGIATSTLSHHIEQLKSVGFINEEKYKNSKFYSINSNSIDKSLCYISKIFTN